MKHVRCTMYSLPCRNENTRKEEKEQEKTHLISPQKSNIIYEKYRICLKRFASLRMSMESDDWARNALNSMFSLIVSKTIACVNKMRVNRFDRTCKTWWTKFMHGIDNNIKYWNQSSFIGLDWIHENGETQTHTRTRAMPTNSYIFSLQLLRLSNHVRKNRSIIICTMYVHLCVCCLLPKQ